MNSINVIFMINLRVNYEQKNINIMKNKLVLDIKIQTKHKCIAYCFFEKMKIKKCFIKI